MSISFDRIAERYDATRGFPPGIDAQVGAAFRHLSGLPASAHLLEIGVGTGRIAIPLASLGYHYTGMDLSLNMMARLRERLPPSVSVALVRGDAAALPLRDESVDGAVVVHVLHLVSGWERAVTELRRVIRPGGTLAIGFNDTSEQIPPHALREHWRDIVHEIGGDTRRPGAANQEIDPLVETLFGAARRAILATWERRTSLREQLDLLATRTTSDTWDVPEPILRRSLERAEAWARETYGDLDHKYTTQANFTMLFYRRPTTDD